MEPSPRYPATVAAAVDVEFVVKKSRFSTHVRPVQTPEDADEQIVAFRKRYWDANHNCVALVTGLLGDHARSSDDGEPSGTAGAPMLDVLRRRGLTDVLVVVTRYFGGVKLGGGGLIRAYSTAASEALDAATLLHRRLLVQASVAVSHADAGKYENVLRDWAQRNAAVLGETIYSDTATLEVWTPPEDSDRFIADLAAASAGELVPTFGERRVVSIPA